jgi:mercuric ion transport protein
MEQATAARSAGLVGAASTAALGLLPKLTCPLCWPAYTAALGALGVGFVDYTPYLGPLTAGFVVLAVIGLAWTSRRRRSVVPVIIGALAGSLLMLGKFAVDSDTLTYGAAALLIAAPFLPARRPNGAACRRCMSEQPKETS